MNGNAARGTAGPDWQSNGRSGVEVAIIGRLMVVSGTPRGYRGRRIKWAYAEIGLANELGDRHRAGV